MKGDGHYSAPPLGTEPGIFQMCEAAKGSTNSPSIDQVLWECSRGGLGCALHARHTSRLAISWLAWAWLCVARRASRLAITWLAWAWLCVARQASRLAISWLASRRLVVSTSHGQPNDPQRVASTGVRNDDPVERHQPRSEH